MFLPPNSLIMPTSFKNTSIDDEVSTCSVSNIVLAFAAALSGVRGILEHTDGNAEEAVRTRPLIPPFTMHRHFLHSLTRMNESLPALFLRCSTIY